MSIFAWITLIAVYICFIMLGRASIFKIESQTADHNHAKSEMSISMTFTGAKGQRATAEVKPEGQFYLRNETNIEYIRMRDFTEDIISITITAGGNNIWFFTQVTVWDLFTGRGFSFDCRKFNKGMCLLSIDEQSNSLAEISLDLATTFECDVTDSCPCSHGSISNAKYSRAVYGGSLNSTLVYTTTTRSRSRCAELAWRDRREAFSYTSTGPSAGLCELHHIHFNKISNYAFPLNVDIFIQCRLSNVTALEP